VYKISAYVTSGMAHNLLLQLWVELGPCGLTAFAWFMATLFFYSIKNIFRIGAAEKEVLHRMGVISATLAFLFQNMFDFGFFIPHVAIIWWILCALAL
jgi:O-antigen ligase